MLETGKLHERSTGECEAIAGPLAPPTDFRRLNEHHDGTRRRGYVSLAVEQDAKPADP
jgi:hypothetical protein